MALKPAEAADAVNWCFQPAASEAAARVAARLSARASFRSVTLISRRARVQQSARNHRRRVSVRGACAA